LSSSDTLCEAGLCNARVRIGRLERKIEAQKNKNNALREKVKFQDRVLRYFPNAAKTKQLVEENKALRNELQMMRTESVEYEAVRSHLEAEKEIERLQSEVERLRELIFRATDVIYNCGLRDEMCNEVMDWYR
jgi:predicted RNase H-like nuclease (RuvC/YqgF family)